VLAAARRRIAAALAVAGIAALIVLCLSGGPARAQPVADAVTAPGPGGGSATARIIFLAVASIAVAAFAVLQLIARASRHRRASFADWRTWPPGYDPWAGR
jgi:hypothetical protein